MFERMAIPEVVKITPKKNGDNRGYFSEIFREDEFRKHVADVSFVQDNQSLSASIGTLRGLHFQHVPAAQGKLIRCLSGKIFDVAVDLRKGSPTFGEHVSVELTCNEGSWLWIPVGFAHGFMTLTPDTIVHYKVTSYYSAEHDRGIRWNDPSLAIAWPNSGIDPVVSAKDQVQPVLFEIEPPFHYNNEQG